MRLMKNSRELASIIPDFLMWLKMIIGPTFAKRMEWVADEERLVVLGKSKILPE